MPSLIGALFYTTIQREWNCLTSVHLRELMEKILQHVSRFMKLEGVLDSLKEPCYER